MAAVHVVPTRVAPKVNERVGNIQQAQGSDLQAEENAPTGGSCPVPVRNGEFLIACFDSLCA